jgi:hypothetical protein
MPIFNSNTLTELEQGLRKADNSLTTNYKGSAPLNATITQHDWLPTTNGLDCKLIHGDRWQEILGSMTEHFTGTVTTNIDTDDHLKVGGVRTVDITGNFTENYFSNYTADIWQTANIHYHAAATTSVDGTANLAQNAPAFTWNGPANYQNFGFQWVFCGSQIQILTTALNVVPTVQIGVTGLNIGAAGIGVDLQGIAIAAHGKDMTLAEVRQKIDLAYGKVKAVLVRAGGASLQAIAKLNAMISAGLGTPFR